MTGSKPILFSGPMIRAILDGRKSMTRRVIKPQPDHFHDFSDGVGWRPQVGDKEYPIPYHIGHMLWVRETWGYWGSIKTPDWVIYRADGDRSGVEWKPSIYMSRWASRITLEVTGLMVQRLQAISEADAMAEGAPIKCNYMGRCNSGRCEVEHYRKGFRELWDSINAKRAGCAWADNPFCWAISFKVVKP